MQAPPAAGAAVVVAVAAHEWSATNKTSTQLALEKEDFNRTLTQEQMILQSSGRYWSKMEDIWDSAAGPIVAADFAVITRTAGQGLLYGSCYGFLHKNIRASDAPSSTANHDNNLLKLDACGNSEAEAAHLICHAKVCHKAYGFLAEAAVGQLAEAIVRPTTGDRRSARVGLASRLRNPPALKRRKILVGVTGTNGSSLKGHRFNKMYLKDQKAYYDTDSPSMLIIPCLTLQQVMDWASNGTTSIAYDALVFTFGAKQVTAATILLHVKAECTAAEIENARDLLQTFVKGVAGSLLTKDVRESFSKKELNEPSNSSLQRWLRLVHRIKNQSNATIETPTALRALPPGFHIAKVRQSLGNSLPDPWLLMMKAAINYSAFRGTKLMPACPPEDDDIGPMNSLQGFEEQEIEDAEQRSAFLLESLERGGFARTTTHETS